MSIPAFIAQLMLLKAGVRSRRKKAKLDKNRPYVQHLIRAGLTEKEALILYDFRVHGSQLRKRLSPWRWNHLLSQREALYRKLARNRRKRL